MEKKYNFKKVDDDNYILEYKDKQIPFKYDVNLIVMMSSINADARMKMFASLKKNGLTADDLKTKAIKDGKTIIDETEYNKMEKAYIDSEIATKAIEIIDNMFNIDALKLIDDIGLNGEEITDFISELFSLNSTPREKTK